MRSILIPLVILALFHSVQAQWGAQTRFLTGESRTLDELGINGSSIYIGPEYHLRLKKNRIEFHPGLGIRVPVRNGDFGQISGFDLSVPVDFYIFDFEGDCDCPVWNKEGEVFKKGFFLEITPGISLQTVHRTNVQATVDPATPVKSQGLISFLGAGAGLDLGISEHITLTPTVSYFFFSGKDWEGLAVDGGIRRLDDQKNIGLGLRIQYHPDKRRRR